MTAPKLTYAQSTKLTLFAFYALWPIIYLQVKAISSIYRMWNLPS